MAEEMEAAEVSAAKNAVWSVLDDFLDAEDAGADLITVADRIVNDLVKRGVLIPEWFPDPHNNDRPAQGHFPTATQMESWEGRPITPFRVTGR